MKCNTILYHYSITSKNYTVNNVVVSLAEATAERITNFARLIGKEDLFELSEIIDTEEGRKKVGASIFKVILNADQVKTVMQICLENSEGVEWEKVPVKQTKEIVTDFFTELVASLQ